ncbi:MAG: argininosuccinate lyase [Thermodesulfovibrionia bacterium]
MDKPWSGRFREKTEKIVEEFTSSVPFDVRLWRYDIEGSVAHARMLAKCGIISKDDADLIVKGLNEVKREIENGRFRFLNSLEDVHMNIEHALIKKIGPVGGRLHTARSRNDQIALDLRLYLRDEIGEIVGLIRSFQDVLLNLSERYIDIIMPGYTHLQRAQPVLLSHHLLAYFDMFERDKERLDDCLKRVNVLPLGSAALAGTSLPIDRRYVARLLGFADISKNSIDAVSDRDFVIEFLSGVAILMVHLSRLAEEFILWNTAEFGFIELPDAFSTGSSIMPQKKNPDALELIRAKSGRTFGDLISILTVMKGLPLAYNRDMQEDKEPLFDAVDTVKGCLSILIRMIPEVRFNKDVMEMAAEGGFSTATDIAEYLVKKGIPFRDAHKLTGKIVRYCIEKGKSLLELDIKGLKRFSDKIDEDIFPVLSIRGSVDSRCSSGGTSGGEVLKRIAEIRKVRGEKI